MIQDELIPQSLDANRVQKLIAAAADRDHIAGWTHNFYRYPARFSPTFAAAAIECLSNPGDIVLDPYMGGGTVVVEALASGRRVVGNDLNSLATFVAQVKTTLLNRGEVRSLRRWADHIVGELSYRTPAADTAPHMQPDKMTNLHLLRARFIKKLVAAALLSIAALPTMNAQRFARCVVLRTSQWALDGRRKQTTLSEFRRSLAQVCHEMLNQLSAFGGQIENHLQNYPGACVLLHGDASEIPASGFFSDPSQRASLVVTSPPYPGVHVLYHRWQVDGRRESPAPYWIINGQDGQSASYYTFGDRRQTTSESYFITSLKTLRAIRQVLRPGGFIVQLVAFSQPESQLKRYLTNMDAARFHEVTLIGEGSGGLSRIWREVPNRKWHAASRGRTHSSMEVVLIHRAV